MKSNYFFRLTLVIVFLLIQIANCIAQVKSANPWKDDYREISSLENYKSWGTYNVHDPAVMRVGNTYYMYSTDAIYLQRRNPGEKRPDVKTGNIQVRMANGNSTIKMV